MAHLGK